MTEYTKLIERLGERYGVPDLSTDQLLNRRDRKRRNQRITAGVVGIAVFVAAIWIVTSGGVFDRSETSVVPGGDVTGRAETGPAETGPAETGPAETGQEPAGGWALPASVTDYIVDLETGAVTPLPKSIVGAEDVTTEYAVSPDGLRLAYVGLGDNGTRAIFVANLDGTGIEQVTVGLRGEWPAWSPDGSKIAYIARMGGGGGNVYVLDLATGVSTQVTYDPGAESPTFSPDGSSIVYSARGQVLAVPSAGGASVTLLGGDVVWAALPVLSPDGSLLSYSCAAAASNSTIGIRSDLCLANSDGTDARELVAPGGAPGKWSPDGERIAFWTAVFAVRDDVYVVDVATGEVTLVGRGARPTWLDGHTLIVEADYCNNPAHVQCPG